MLGVHNPHKSNMFSVLLLVVSSLALAQANPTSSEETFSSMADFERHINESVHKIMKGETVQGVSLNDKCFEKKAGGGSESGAEASTTMASASSSSPSSSSSTQPSVQPRHHEANKCIKRGESKVKFAQTVYKKTCVTGMANKNGVKVYVKIITLMPEQGAQAQSQSQ